MFDIVNLSLKDIDKMCDLYNEARSEENFFQILSHEQFKKLYVGNEDFSFDGVFGVFDKDNLIAYSICLLRKFKKICPSNSQIAKVMNIPPAQITRILNDAKKLQKK